MPLSVYSAGKTWTFSGIGNWSDASNWNPTGAPLSTDDVIITSTVVITNTSGTISSFTFSGSGRISLGDTFAVLSDTYIANGCTLSTLNNNLYLGGNLNCAGELFYDKFSCLYFNIYFNGGEGNNRHINWEGSTFARVAVLNSSSVTMDANFTAGNLTVESNAYFYESDHDCIIKGNVVVKGTYVQETNNLSLDNLIISSGGNYSQIDSGTVNAATSIKSYGTFTQKGNIYTANLTLYDNSVFNQGTASLYIKGTNASIKANATINTNSLGKIVFHGGGTIDAVIDRNIELGNIQLSEANTTLKINHSKYFMPSSLTVDAHAVLKCYSSLIAFPASETYTVLSNVKIDGEVNFNANKITVLVKPKENNGITVSKTGKLSVSGYSSNEHYMLFASYENGKQFILKKEEGAEINLNYVNIRDCDASSGEIIYTKTFCVDLGNNTDIRFSPVPYSAIDSLEITQKIGSGILDLKWTAVGKDRSFKTAESYVLKYSTVLITSQELFNNSAEYVQNWTPLTESSIEEKQITGLNKDNILYAAIEAKDKEGLSGGISAIKLFTVIIDPALPVSYVIPGERGNVRVEVPEAAFGEQVSFTGNELNDNTMPPLFDQSELRSVGLGVELNITPSNAKIIKPVTIRIKYEDSDIIGLDESKFKIARYNETMGKWYTLRSRRDNLNNYVYGETMHFSKFRIVEYTYAGLNSVKIFPNPWKIGTNGNFGAENLTFKNLPEKGRIRIYNVAGEIVKDASISVNDDGFMNWDGTNTNSSKVSSGVYIAYVEDEINNHRIIKVALVR